MLLLFNSKMVELFVFEIVLVHRSCSGSLLVLLVDCCGLNLGESGDLVLESRRLGSVHHHL